MSNLLSVVPGELTYCPECADVYGWVQGLPKRCSCERSTGLPVFIREFGMRGPGEICWYCQAEIRHSGTRWTTFFCEVCRPGIVALNDQLDSEGRVPLPVGIHSLLHARYKHARPFTSKQIVKEWSARRLRQAWSVYPGSDPEWTAFAAFLRQTRPDLGGLVELVQAAATDTFYDMIQAANDEIHAAKDGRVSEATPADSEPEVSQESPELQLLRQTIEDLSLTTMAQIERLTDGSVYDPGLRAWLTQVLEAAGGEGGSPTVADEDAQRDADEDDDEEDEQDAEQYMAEAVEELLADIGKWKGVISLCGVCSAPQLHQPDAPWEATTCEHLVTTWELSGAGLTSTFEDGYSAGADLSAEGEYLLASLRRYVATVEVAVDAGHDGVWDEAPDLAWASAVKGYYVDDVGGGVISSLFQQVFEEDPAAVVSNEDWGSDNPSWCGRATVWASDHDAVLKRFGKRISEMDDEIIQEIDRLGAKYGAVVTEVPPEA